MTAGRDSGPRSCDFTARSFTKAAGPYFDQYALTIVSIISLFFNCIQTGYSVEWAIDIAVNYN